MSTDDSDQPDKKIDIPTIQTPKTDQKLDGEGYNIINHEDIEDVDEEEEEEEEEEEQSLYRPGLAGLLGGRMMQRNRNQPEKFHALHPFCQVLSKSNIDDCVTLEEDAFPESERCSAEKFIYRLSRCPELCLGLFSRPQQTESEKRSNPNPRHLLLAQIVSTRTPSRHVTNASLACPPDWRNTRSSLPKAGEEPLGHTEMGGTIAIHSLAVAKEHQHKGLGSILLKSYIERIKSAKIADRICLLAHDPLVKFYEGFGFVNEGLSLVQIGPDPWNSMVLEFSDQLED